MTAVQNRAVFLSYASQDAEAARRICEALRAAGVEVWFDQSELRGGDAWDAKIRKQIKECALFVPIVSATTEERHEGYFRREWKLAVERTHDMAASRAFLLPVVIDATREAGAEVPEEFMRVQWTRMSNGMASPEFVAQVKRLLEPRSARVAGTEPAIARPEPKTVFVAGSGSGRPGHRKKIGWALVGFGGLVVLAAILGPGRWWRRDADSAAPLRPEAVARTTPVDAKSIAVLPFENLSRDPQNDVFTEGMHDDVVTALTKIHDLTVISRSAVLVYKSSSRNLRAIAGELGVAHLLEGSVHRDGSRIKLNVQLTDAQTSRQLWANHYTEAITDTFAVQEKLAEAITSALKARFSPAERTLITRRTTENQEAYELFMRASRLEESGGQRNRDAYGEAIALYELAVAKDPKFALAYARLTATHGLFYWFNWGDAGPARREKAKAALDAAERLAPDAPETMVARGVYAYRCENDFARALAHYLAAERELPNDAALQDHIGAALRRLGRLEEAAQRFERGHVLNPHSLALAESCALSYFYLRRYARVNQFVEQKRTAVWVPVLEAGFDETELRLIDEVDARARYALDGDEKRYVAAIVKSSRSGALGYAQARRIGDLATAEAALARLVAAGRKAGDVADASYPIPLLQAQLAFIRGRREDARRFGSEAAAAEPRVMTPNPRQDLARSATLGLALAYAGRDAEGTELGENAFLMTAARDKFQASTQALVVAETFLVAGKPDRALDYLEQSCAARALVTAAELRRDPLWASLRTNPRFDALLKQLSPR